MGTSCQSGCALAVGRDAGGSVTRPPLVERAFENLVECGLRWCGRRGSAIRTTATPPRLPERVGAAGVSQPGLYSEAPDTGQAATEPRSLGTPRRACARLDSLVTRLAVNIKNPGTAKELDPRQHATYLRHLQDAVANMKDRNIALAGRYGTGKSSVLDKFERPAGSDHRRWTRPSNRSTTSASDCSPEPSSHRKMPVRTAARNVAVMRWASSSSPPRPRSTSTAARSRSRAI